MAYLKTKLENNIGKIIPKQQLRFKLSNIRINGVNKGCSGHITFVPSGRCVYVNTKPLITDPNKLMYRYAKDENDYSSHHADFVAMNLFSTKASLPYDITAALTCPEERIRSISRSKP